MRVDSRSSGRSKKEHGMNIKFEAEASDNFHRKKETTMKIVFFI